MGEVGECGRGREGEGEEEEGECGAHLDGLGLILGRMGARVEVAEVGGRSEAAKEWREGC